MDWTVYPFLLCKYTKHGEYLTLIDKNLMISMISEKNPIES